MSRTLVVRFPTHAAAFFVFLFSAHTAFAVPTFTSAPAGSANVGETYIYAIATADSESGDRSVSATALPSWLELTGIDAENGSATLQGTPTQANVGPHTVSLSVTNSLTNETATQEFGPVHQKVRALRGESRLFLHLLDPYLRFRFRRHAHREQRR